MRSFAERGPFPTPLLALALEGCFGPEGSLPAEIEGEGDEVLESPLVWMPGGRLIFECITVAEADADGAISRDSVGNYCQGPR